jgi:hypothetical protein
MPVVDLSFVTDDSKQVVFIQHIRAGVPSVRWDQLLRTAVRYSERGLREGFRRGSFRLALQ